MKTAIFWIAITAIISFYFGLSVGRENNPIVDDYKNRTETLIDSVCVWYPDFQDTYMESDTYASYDYISSKIN